MRSTKRIVGGIRQYLLTLAMLVSSVGMGIALWGFITPADNAGYMKISKSLAIFGEFFRQVSSSYVDEIDPLEFIKAGIDGMVKHLDPYTSYISDEENEEVDIITTGVYGGLGIVTSTIDSAVTIVGITEGCVAERAGLRIGDKIYAVDSTVVLRSSSEELRKLTRGKAGTTITMRILRAGVRDTLQFTLQRQEVVLKNVSYYGIVRNTIGYVRIERFTHNAPNEVREAVLALQKLCADRKSVLQGLILDVRENPGGLLDAAVGVCELFLPSGTQVVATRGRTADSERRYHTRRPPLDDKLPLAVLIDNNTASASEIVAGALQDLDRAVVIGERSFGKGLVQTISSLPYDATLKMTTAKYYMPSGRCIQKIDYNDRRHGIIKPPADTGKIFTTVRGRIVHDASGITPDTIVRPRIQHSVVGELLKRNVVFAFANEFSGAKASLPPDFSADRQLFNQFVGYVKRSKLIYESATFRKVQELESLLKSSGTISHNLAAALDATKHQMMKDQLAELERQREEVRSLLYEEILKRFYPRSAVLQKMIEYDTDVQAAVAILHDVRRYKAMLRQL
ncbi:MAG: S41 family peptidase [Bacteroidota bacterium]|nr:S41 family peptidase [Candidatus Kapabacteria bacterium]MDW8220762.1 S41 family peptidase [Bacteroidota bacterium]